MWLSFVAVILVCVAPDFSVMWLNRMLKKCMLLVLQDKKSGKTPIHYAIERRDLCLLETLMEMAGSGLLPSLLRERTFDGNTSLHYAVGLTNMPEEEQVSQPTIYVLLTCATMYFVVLIRLIYYIHCVFVVLRYFRFCSNKDTFKLVCPQRFLILYVCCDGM